MLLRLPYEDVTPVWYTAHLALLCRECLQQRLAGSVPADLWLVDDTAPHPLYGVAGGFCHREITVLWIMTFPPLVRKKMTLTCCTVTPSGHGQTKDGWCDICIKQQPFNWLIQGNTDWYKPLTEESCVSTSHLNTAFSTTWWNIGQQLTELLMLVLKTLCNAASVKSSKMYYKNTDRLLKRQQ